MAQSSIFWTTGSTGDGASAYTQAQLFDWVKRSFGDGVIYEPGNGLDNLAVSGSASPLSVESGSAIVAGIPYTSTAAENIAFSNPGTTIGARLVLRADWTAQTVRLALLESVNSSLPALTQTDGTIWEISLASMQISPSGTVSDLTDERSFVTYSGNPLSTVGQTAQTVEGNVTVEGDFEVESTIECDGQIRSNDNMLVYNSTPVFDLYETDGSSNEKRWRMRSNSEVFSLSAADDAGSNTSTVYSVHRTGYIPDFLRIQTEMQLHMDTPVFDIYNTNGATNEKRWRIRADATTLKIQTLNDSESIIESAITITRGGGTVSTIEFAENSVILPEVTRVGSANQPFLAYIQNDGSADWNQPGTTNQIPAGIRVKQYLGSIQLNASGFATVTFQSPYQWEPFVFVSIADSDGGYGFAWVDNLSETGFTVLGYNFSGGVLPNATIHWMSVGR